MAPRRDAASTLLKIQRGETPRLLFLSEIMVPTIPNAVEIGYFDPTDPVENLEGNLPHFRQSGRTYFVTFRTADSIPRQKLEEWLFERTDWLARHPEPHSLESKREYFQRFTARIQGWLDAGFGECELARVEVRDIVVKALNHFQHQRYQLRAWVVMPNHVHVVLTPIGDHQVSEITHSWKSYTSKGINKLLGRQGNFWQKESFDHIVRSPESLERIEAYIRANPKGLAEGTYALSDSK